MVTGSTKPKCLPLSQSQIPYGLPWDSGFSSTGSFCSQRYFSFWLCTFIKFGACRQTVKTSYTNVGTALPILNHASSWSLHSSIMTPGTGLLGTNWIGCWMGSRHGRKEQSPFLWRVWILGIQLRAVLAWNIGLEMFKIFWQRSLEGRGFWSNGFMMSPPCFKTQSYLWIDQSKLQSKAINFITIVYQVPAQPHTH